MSAVAFYLADRKLPAGGLYPLYAERGEEVFFEKPLAVVNTFVTNETLLTDTLLPAYSFTRREDPVSVSPDRMTYDTRSGEIG